MVESEAVPVTGRLQPRCYVENDRVVDEMVLAQFVEDHLSQHLYSRRIEPHVEQSVRVASSRNIQIARR